jgi:hypothetical protein
MNERGAAFAPHTTSAKANPSQSRNFLMPGQCRAEARHAMAGASRDKKTSGADPPEVFIF